MNGIRTTYESVETGICLRVDVSVVCERCRMNANVDIRG